MLFGCSKYKALALHQLGIHPRIHLGSYSGINYSELGYASTVSYTRGHSVLLWDSAWDMQQLNRRLMNHGI